tara:strand:+ start:171 stop:893 length:723 start_codon:yes stop_codon:yes gene_type:complete
MKQTALSALVVAGLAGSLFGAALQPAAAETTAKVENLATWDRSALQKGWSARALLQRDVYGPGGNEIGEVEDILVGPDNKIRGIIVETNAFLDIGDVHAEVAWDKVSAGPEADSVSIPLTKETLENWYIDRDDRNVKRAWRVDELIGDTVSLKDVRGYGYVDDVIFNDNGEIVSVIVSARYGGRYGYGAGYGVGPYAYPFYGYNYGWTPGLGYYNLPYGRTEIADYEPYRYERKGPFQNR